MQRSISNPSISQPRPAVYKTLAVTREATEAARSAAPAQPSHKTWSDQMREIDRLEDAERWDGLS